MVSKSEILKDLKNDLGDEESIIKQLTDFYKALGWKNVVKLKYHKEVEEGLTMLREDTEKHTRLVREMIAYIERSGKREF